jgi:hypothetical protein
MKLFLVTSKTGLRIRIDIMRIRILISILQSIFISNFLGYFLSKFFFLQIQITKLRNVAQKSYYWEKVLFLQSSIHRHGKYFLIAKRSAEKTAKAVFILPIKRQCPDPDPTEPHVFGPPGSGSGSFHHHAKIVRKTLIPNILLLFLTFYLWKMMQM